ncbi:G-type lectin S-receptor-like serine/threonine-protein kinase At4g27290 [Linum grandiflorum]
MHLDLQSKQRRLMAGLAGIACALIYCFSRTCIAQDTSNPDKPLRDGGSLISVGGRFEFGFFSPARSRNRFLGIWYRNITPQTVVWVANREVPVTERVGVFNITSQGNLTLVDATQTLVWSSNSSRFLQSPIVKLLDSGNLVVKDGNDKNPENYLWQNFDYPCDTLLPGMKTGIVNSLNKPLTSWKSAEDPGNGEFSLKIYSQGYPQGYVKNGNRTLFRIGSWNGERFTGIPTLKQSSTFTYEFVLNENEMYFKFETTDGSALPKYTIYPSGLLQHYTWNDQTNDWMVLATTQVDQCENYALCGTYAGCYIYNSPICSCLEGFAPKSPTDWNLTKWSDGCIRRTPLGCNRNDGFPKYKGIKVPDTSSSSYTRSISLAECAVKAEGLIEMNDHTKEEIDLPIFDLDTVVDATNNFSNSKLGEGGFGPVYKGTLPEGQGIAVKRLSKSFGQGLNEFKNEFILFSKLQHHNLVKLLGCCISEDEKMLIYEYMPNKSLDSIIFGKKDSRLRIIRRDLKASNILLDNDMKPKISDFGLAKTFEANQTEANTNRVVGTHGYMSPEYAIDGIYSMKSDIFSYGVLVLEIISGKRNRGFHHPAHDLNLIGHRRLMAGIIVLACGFIFCFSTCSAQDTLKPGETLINGEILASTGGRFELGFFSSLRSRNRFLGIWYKHITPQTIVWVANREAPIVGRDGFLNITSQGNLTLLDATKTLVWSSNSSRSLQSPVVKLLDSGNLVVKDANDDNPENYLWQSFDYPCDTLLPGMKTGIVNGLDKPLTSWKSTEDPAKGEYSLEIDARGYPQGYLKKGNRIQFRKVHSWGEQFTKTSVLQQSPTITYHFVFNKNEAYFKFETTGASAIARYTIYPSGLLQRNSWNDQTNTWMVLSTGQVDQCENYALCGAYGTCYIQNSPLCSCLDGFRPKSPEDWNLTKWSAGCVRKTPLSCNRNDGFLKYGGMKVPDTSSSLYIRSIHLSECEGLCLNNCSCTAYASSEISNRESGCLLWFGDLADIRGSADSGQDLYVKVAASELDQFRETRTSNEKKRTIIIAIAVSVSVLFLSLMTLGIGCFIKRRRKLRITDKSRSKQLDWYKRVEIIDGIARGLLYLHQDSRLRIIHRDLKASNILLDNDMKPKISDFGLAKTFGADQTEAKTTRVVGTHGYMSPEYVADGKYSMKSDIFSFGVLVLEIVSGKRNRGFHHPSNDLNLVGHAWTLWKEGSVLETVDECLRESCKDSQAIVRYIQVALLCVQQRPEDRPNMSSVVLMLGSVDPLPQPKQPGFFVARNPYDVRDDSLTEKESQSVNEVTMTVLEAR